MQSFRIPPIAARKPLGGYARLRGGRLGARFQTGCCGLHLCYSQHEGVSWTRALQLLCVVNSGHRTLRKSVGRDPTAVYLFRMRGYDGTK